MWWHTRRNQISSFGETDETTYIGGGASFQSTVGIGVVRISDSDAGYSMFRGSVKSTGYPLHLPVSLSLPLPASPYAITFQLDSTFMSAAHRSLFYMTTIIYEFRTLLRHACRRWDKWIRSARFKGR